MPLWVKIIKTFLKIRRKFEIYMILDFHLECQAFSKAHTVVLENIFFLLYHKWSTNTTGGLVAWQRFYQSCRKVWMWFWERPLYLLSSLALFLYLTHLCMTCLALNNRMRLKAPHIKGIKVNRCNCCHYSVVAIFCKLYKKEEVLLTKRRCWDQWDHPV